MKKFTLALLALSLLAACTSEKQMKEQMAKIVKENPEVILGAIDAHPDKFIEALNNAVKKAQEGQGKKREDEEKKQLEEAFNNPLKAEIRSDESIRGTKGAPITLVEYSDFECPFCSRGYSTVMELMDKYKGKIAFIYKHLPLSFHPQAMISSQYYEAVRLQSAEKAYQFHDKIYKNQGALKNGEPFLKKSAQELGVDMKKLAADVTSEAVKKRIEADMEEAGKYGFQGTPGFLINGVPVRGAYPANHFEGIISELQKRGKISL
ncbi:MAG: DsbA family protein [Bacteriovoracaceae bacterium]